MIKVLCDRCGKEIEETPDDSRRYVVLLTQGRLHEHSKSGNKVELSVWSYAGGKQRLDYADLCEECWAEFVNTFMAFNQRAVFWGS